MRSPEGTLGGAGVGPTAADPQVVARRSLCRRLQPRPPLDPDNYQRLQVSGFSQRNWGLYLRLTALLAFFGMRPHPRWLASVRGELRKCQAQAYLTSPEQW